MTSKTPRPGRRVTKREKEAWTATPQRLDVQFVADACRAIALDEFQRDSTGAVLVFVSGALEIQQICRILERDPTLYPLPLHGSLPAKEQRRAFDAAPKGKTKIVVATNVAETSITIPRRDGRRRHAAMQGDGLRRV